MNKNSYNSDFYTADTFVCFYTGVCVRADRGAGWIRRDEEENSTDKERGRERINGGRFLREMFGTGLGVLCEEHSAAPAITVREDERIGVN
ncbi:MAG: hypothetical protein K2P48_10995 [Lachnospiraceae bacterium]|nr:hypothetical protein [Lachnospiraceae bacterium]